MSLGELMPWRPFVETPWRQPPGPDLSQIKMGLLMGCLIHDRPNTMGILSGLTGDVQWQPTYEDTLLMFANFLCCPQVEFCDCDRTRFTLNGLLNFWVARDGFDWRPNESIPEDYYA